MFRQTITITTATKITTTINALASAGDPATAELMRKWFNSTFKGFRLETVLDGRKILGYRLTSDLYGTTLRETEVKCPGTRRGQGATAAKAVPEIKVDDPNEEPAFSAEDVRRAVNG